MSIGSPTGDRRLTTTLDSRDADVGGGALADVEALVAVDGVIIVVADVESPSRHDVEAAAASTTTAADPMTRRRDPGPSHRRCKVTSLLPREGAHGSTVGLLGAPDPRQPGDPSQRSV